MELNKQEKRDIEHVSMNLAEVNKNFKIRLTKNDSTAARESLDAMIRLVGSIYKKHPNMSELSPMMEGISMCVCEFKEQFPMKYNPKPIIMAYLISKII